MIDQLIYPPNFFSKNLPVIFEFFFLGGGGGGEDLQENFGNTDWLAS